MSCYVAGCIDPVEWLIWIDGSLCCDKHAEEIGSYVTELKAIPEALPKMFYNRCCGNKSPSKIKINNCWKIFFN